MTRGLSFTLLAFWIASAAGCAPEPIPYRGIEPAILTVERETVLPDTLIYHPVRVDQHGGILPWRSADLGASYDDVMARVWSFWDGMEVCASGLKYYMNHQVWSPTHDRRGLGGDQLAMALSSWNLYYDYTGNPAVLENMRYIADQYLARSFSAPDNLWPNLPYPYNMDVESSIYDGDMIMGRDYLQPDKAGSFAYELVTLYKKTGQEKYLDAAVTIANTLADKVQPGDENHSPWPFKVNAKTGELGVFIAKGSWYEGMHQDLLRLDQGQVHMWSSYTTNWTATLRLFTELIDLGRGNADAYRRAFDMTLAWMKTVPVKDNKWGPFFEDVPRWSDTQINAITYATYLMEHQDLDPDWRDTVKGIFAWVHDELDDRRYEQYGVIAIDEQTGYRQPGNSHSSRQASAELMYWELTGDTTYVANAVRMLNWATYMVDNDGKNFYPTNAIWMTDGYGDYVRHYLRAMAAAPELAPAGTDRLLRTSSVVQQIAYGDASIIYTTFDRDSEETFRLAAKPSRVTVGTRTVREVADNSRGGWTWLAMDQGGVLKLRHTTGDRIEITKGAPAS